jgi:ferritin
MLSETLQKAINEQIKDEFYASHLYLSMAAYFEANSLPGFAHWMEQQSSEERNHAMRFYAYVNDRGGCVVLKEIGKPPSDFGSPLEVFEKALQHEQKVTASINEIYALAVKEGDYATQVMLNWFVEEQVEEEKSATDVIDMLKRAGDKEHVLLMIDRQLGAREDDD